MVRRIVRWIDLVADVCGWIAAWLVVILTLLMGVEVFSRYVLDSPTKFSFDVSMIIQLLIATLALAYVLKIERHTMVELLSERVSSKTTRKMNVWMSLVSAVYCGIMVYLSVLMSLASWKMGEKTMVLEVSVFPLKLSLAVGFLLFGIQFVTRAYKNWTFKESGVHPHGGDEVSPVE